jgi:hypothetical protein
MPKKRYIHTISRKERVSQLFEALAHVFRDKQSDRPQNNTDIKTYATHYLGKGRWRKEDFQEIEHMTIKEFIEIFETFNVK